MIVDISFAATPEPAANCQATGGV